MRQQKGVALIIVLLVVALVSVLATEMGGRLQLHVKRAANIKDANQAYWYAMGAEQFARQSIQQLVKNSKNVIHLGQPWNQEFTYPLEGGGIQAQLMDMQACFNLNAVGQVNAANPTANSPERDAFHRLLTNAELEIDSFTADTLADSLADWLDEDDQMRPFGAEDAMYEANQPPYLAANNLMANKSELRLVQGVEQKWLMKLMPLVCAVPGLDSLRINVNTLDDEKAAILAGLTGLSMQDAKRLISIRPPDGYSQVSNFLAEPMINALSLNKVQQDWFRINTEHFILHTKTKYNNATFKMTSVFKVEAGNQVSVIRREFGGV